MQWSALGCAAAMVMLAGATSTASAISIRFDGVTPVKTVSISTDGGSHFRSYKAGLNNFTGGSSNPSLVNGQFDGFCIDFAQSISSGHTYSNYTLVPLEQGGTPAMGPAAAGMISELWARHFDSLNTPTEYAAFQCSIWEILYDTGVNFSGGSFRMGSGSVRTLAQSWVSELNGSPSFHATNLVAIRSPTAQDMLVPTPGSAVLVIGGMGVAMVRRKRR